MSKAIIRNRIMRIMLVGCIGVLLLAMVPLAGCTHTPEAPPAYLLQWDRGSGNTQGLLYWPGDVAVDAAGNVFVVDAGQRNPSLYCAGNHPSTDYWREWRLLKVGGEGDEGKAVTFSKMA